MYNYWTVEETNFLKEHYKTMTGKELVKKLGRTSCSIRHRARELGIAQKQIKKNPAKTISGYKNSKKFNVEKAGKAKARNLINIKESFKDKDKIRVEIWDTRDTTRKLTGKIIAKNDYFITVKFKNYIESLLYTDFYNNYAKVL